MDEKLETELNLALNTPNEEREKSQDLEIGYNQETKEWELIVQYAGSLEEIGDFTNQKMIPLDDNFVIVYLPENRIDAFSRLDSVIYIEKPKTLLTQVVDGIGASCILPVRSENLNLRGNGVLLGVVDTGIDIFHPDFRNDDGTSKILMLWDQSENGENGVIYTKNQINNSLDGSDNSIVAQRDFSGHGTHVASICGGRRGVCPESEFIIVKLANVKDTGFPSTTQLMRGIKFVLDMAILYKKPVSINISYGNHYGDHSGNSLLETFISNSALRWKCCICIGTGNEGDTGRHKQGKAQNEREVIFEIAPFETNLNLQIWKNYEDVFDIYLESPAGNRKKLEDSPRTLVYEFGSTRLYIYFGNPTPYNARQEIYISFLPQDLYLEQGQWKILLEPKSIRDGTFEMWLPVSSGTNLLTRFLEPSKEFTLTVPSTARRVIAVGAYNSNLQTYGTFSGRGDWENCMLKPDLVAPGVNILGASLQGGYTRRSGTSMATPFVTGAAALLMEWGIVNGNDAYLYGEKIKAYLRKGAREFPEMEEPNSLVGWGALCVKNSIPK